jgi:RNA polymerase sigma-70 factor (TIGR02960 family)
MSSASEITDEDTFGSRAERHRRELHVHCYRMLASFDQAEDAVQETLLRAWRSRQTYAGSTDEAQGAQFRAWLYRIATNVCLDQRRGAAKKLTAVTSFAEVPWLQPYPDRLLDEVASGEGQPDVQVVERETIELAFLVALQVLPPRQRAALVARDMLGWSAQETAALLETTVAAANSAVQRARATMQQHLPARRSDWSTRETNAEERELLRQFIDAHERYDATAALAVAARDIRVTMPPYPMVFDGVEALVPLLERAFGDAREGDWRLLPTRVNRMPAAASYLRRPAEPDFRPFKLDVLRVRDRAIAEITTFGPELFEACGLPATLPR